MTLRLNEPERAMIEGDDGPAVAMAMRIVAGLGEANGADRLIEISSAHIDGALYAGLATLDYAERLRDLGGQVKVRTTMNVASLDLLHPELFRGDDVTRTKARAAMQAYEDMGCAPTWTCAPYQLPDRPAFGERVAWAESNAIVFANSVLGARTDRLGDFIDIAAALTGRAPEAGMYLDENRLAGVEYDVSAFSDRLKGSEEFFAILGLFIGADSGGEVPAVTGLEAATEDQLKVMGAASATSGSVALIHTVGITPEAPSLAEATHGRSTRVVVVTPEMLKVAAEKLSLADPSASLRSVSVGTPHYSLDQIARLSSLLGDRSIADSVTFYVNTGRDVLSTVPNVSELEGQGITFVTDTCTYITPILEATDGIAMSDSAKWAYYAPGTLGVQVLFASTIECVESAVHGQIIRGDDPWR